MNAIVGLCHFCESHGPRVVFFTQVIKKNESKTQHNLIETEQCPACTSVGKNKSLLSKEKNGILFCSKQMASSVLIESLLKHACVRSLSCEVSASKENALVFFGDVTQGYVLSYTFQLKDTQARGLKRLFSIIIIMKDKMFLLNLTPHFSKEMKIVADELENLSNEMYAKEQASCPQRAFRLRRGKIDSEPPRSLTHLTGKSNVFGYLHLRFSGMLSSASKVYTEVSSNQFLAAVDTTKVNNLTEFTLRQLREYLIEENFHKIIYCTLIGIQVIVRGDSDKCGSILFILETLLPKTSECCEYVDYVPPTESRLYMCKPNVAVPQPCSAVCRIDIVDELPVLHWSGDLPSKWPTLMTNLIKAINEHGFSDLTLKHHIYALREEWKNNAMALKLVQNSSQNILVSMKRSLGIKTQDESLLEYWMSNFVK